MQGQPEILMEDEDIVVCRKPPGLAVQSASAGRQDMVSLLKNYRAGKGEVPEIFVVHRLDQPVEGLIVFAKHKKAASILSRNLQQRQVDKYYLAMVEGIPKPSEAELEDYLLRDGKTNCSQVVEAAVPGARIARLSYRVLESYAEGRFGQCRSLLEIHLETGRHHQIRVQMAHAGYPLVGDKKYNPRCEAGYLPIGLCSARLSFGHPSTGERLDFSIKPQGEAFCGK